MRLLLINGNTTQAITDRCAAAARAVASPGTEIVPLTAPRGPRVIGTRAENAAAAGVMLEMLAAHADRCDAVLIAVSFDTALDALRKAASVPVVGMTQAALHVAAMLGGPIGFIAPGLRVQDMYRDVVERAGFSGMIAAYCPLDMQPADFDDPSRLVSKVGELANDLVTRDGAASVIVAGAALSGLIGKVQANVNAPVVDGIAAGVVLAEALVRLKGRNA